MSVDTMELGNTGIFIPSMVMGTSSLGNLYEAIPYAEKLEMVKTYQGLFPDRMMFDSAGKYGAGLALETLGSTLHDLQIPKEQVIISNKLGWKRAPLRGAEPTFERDVWKDLKHDAVQDISYTGILECFIEGNELLNGYDATVVSVHDPDEYLAQAESKESYAKRFNDILEAYAALAELKKSGKVKAIGVGSKDWKVIQQIYAQFPLDWVMIANSMTIYSHPQELFEFMQQLKDDGVGIVNSAVFHSGFLVGGAFFDYQKMSSDDSRFAERHAWRNEFFRICEAFAVNPAHACIQFGINIPGVDALALNSTSPKRMASNANYCSDVIPDAFWNELRAQNLIAKYLIDFDLNNPI